MSGCRKLPPVNFTALHTKSRFFSLLTSGILAPTEAETIIYRFYIFFTQTEKNFFFLERLQQTFGEVSDKYHSFKCKYPMRPFTFTCTSPIPCIPHKEAFSFQ